MLTLTNLYVLHGLGELPTVDRTRFARLAGGATA